MGAVHWLYAKILLSLSLLGAALQLSGCATTTELQPGDRQSIAGKTFVITGASSGLGRGVAISLASYGANVVLSARRTKLLEEVAIEASAAGGAPLVVSADVGRPEDVQRLAEAAITRFGSIDVWINNAGVGAIGRFESIPVEDHSRLIDVNLKGVIYGSHVAMRQFRAQGYGTLVNIGSMASEVPLAYYATYAASKAAVLSLGRTLNEEIRLSGSKTIRVATVMPAAVDTPWWTHAANYSGGLVRMAPMEDPQKVVRPLCGFPFTRARNCRSAGWRISPTLPTVSSRTSLRERLQITHTSGNSRPPRPRRQPPVPCMNPWKPENPLKAALENAWNGRTASKGDKSEPLRTLPGRLAPFRESSSFLPRKNKLSILKGIEDGRRASKKTGCIAGKIRELFRG